jgi:hypothetical protein
MFTILLDFSSDDSFKLEGRQAEVTNTGKEADTIVAFGSEKCELHHEGQLGRW